MAADTTIERIPGYCALCTSVCGCISVVEDGRLVAVEPDPSHPTGKALCGKGRAAPELVYHEDRVLHPLRRVTRKDAPGEWERIGWDEALDETARHLKRLAAEHGPESVAFAITTPSGTGIQDSYPWIERLRHAYGSPNAPYGTEICNFHRDDIYALTFGVDTADARFPERRLHRPLGAQPEHHLARLCQPGRRSEGARRQAHRRRSAPRRPRGQGGCVAPCQARQRRARSHWASPICSWKPGATTRPSCGTGPTARCWCATTTAARSAPTTCVRAETRRSGWRGMRTPARRCSTTQAPAATDGGVPALDGRYEIAGADGTTIPCRTAFDLYRERCRAFTPERVEEIAWVPAEQLRAAARLMGEADAVSSYSWSGVGPAHQCEPDLARHRAPLCAERQLRCAGRQTCCSTPFRPTTSEVGR